MNTRPETKSISLEYDLPYPPAKVWRALTDPALLAAWLMKNDMQPVVGTNFTFRAEPTPWWDGIVRCEVMDSVPPKLLRYAWRSGSPPSGLDTVVTWTLTPTASGGTLLAMEHSGFRPDDQFANDGAIKGWKHMLADSLPAVLAGMS